MRGVIVSIDSVVVIVVCRVNGDIRAMSKVVLIIFGDHQNNLESCHCLVEYNVKEICSDSLQARPITGERGRYRSVWRSLGSSSQFRGNCMNAVQIGRHDKVVI